MYAEDFSLPIFLSLHGTHFSSILRLLGSTAITSRLKDCLSLLFVVFSFQPKTALCVHVRMCVHSPVQVWRSEVNNELLPQSLSTLLLETESLTKLRTQNFVCTDWPKGHRICLPPPLQAWVLAWARQIHTQVLKLHSLHFAHLLLPGSQRALSLHELPGKNSGCQAWRVFTR